MAGTQSGQVVSLGKAATSVPAVAATYALTAASAQAVAANASRAGVRIVNNSANPVYLGLAGAAAVVGSGVCIPPYGGAWVSTLQDAGAIFAIAATAIGTLSIQEWT